MKNAALTQSPGRRSRGIPGTGAGASNPTRRIACGRRLPLAKHIREGDRIKKEILRIAATRVKDGALQAKFDIFLEHPNKLWHWIKNPNIPAENNWAERCIRNTVIFRKTGFGPQGEAAMADRETLQRKDDFPYQARPTELKSCSLRATTALIASTFDLRVSR